MQNQEKRVANSATSASPKDARADDIGKTKPGGESRRLPPVKVSSSAITDGGKVRLGAMTPSL
jgi:hypothetical protein